MHVYVIISVRGDAKFWLAEVMPMKIGRFMVDETLNEIKPYYENEKKED